MSDLDYAAAQPPVPPRAPEPTEERVPQALAAGLAAAAIGAVLWAVVATMAHLELGFLAWGIGGLVGVAMGAVTRSRGQSLATLAALVAAVGLVMGKSLAVQLSTGPSLIREIQTDTLWMAQAALQDLQARGEMPGEIQQQLNAMAYDDTLSDALWVDMLGAGAAHAEAMGAAERERIASDYADVLMANVTFFDLLSSQLSVYDLLWFGLALATAWRIMRGKGDEEPAEVPIENEE